MMSTQSEAPSEQAWQQLVQAEKRYFAARKALFQVIRLGGDVSEILRRALRVPSERGTALRLLRMLDESVRREMFPTLVDLASAAHSDIQLVREVIVSLDPQWLTEHLPPEVERILEQASSYEEYRRLAELLRMIRSPYLATLVEKAAASDDLDVREVAEDFGM